MIIFDDSDIRFFILILKLVLALFRLFFIFLLIFLILVSLALFLLLFKLSLFLELVYTLSLPNLIISDDSFSHLIIVRVYKFPKNLFLFFILFLKLFVEKLYLSYFCRKLKESRLIVIFICS